MRRFTAVPLLVVLLVALSYGQAKPAGNATGRDKPATTATPADTAAGLPSEATVESFLKRTFSYDPNLQWKIVSIRPSDSPGVAEVVIAMKSAEGQQGMKLFVLPGGKFAVVGDMIPFGADPFASSREKLAKANGPARGPANAELTIVEFSDLECPSCKAAQPTIDRLLTDLPNARFVFQNYPLEQLHPWAFKAAAYADCVGRENVDAFWKFIHTVYENQEQVTPETADAKLKEYATQAGVNAAQTATCAAQPATAERVRQSQALGASLDITGTPTVFLNGRKVQNVNGIPYELLKTLATSTQK